MIEADHYHDETVVMDEVHLDSVVEEVRPDHCLDHEDHHDTMDVVDAGADVDIDLDGGQEEEVCFERKMMKDDLEVAHPHHIDVEDIVSDEGEDIDHGY